MEYHIDREVRLSEESEHKILYSWSLQEFSKDGVKVGRDQIPWKWNVFFSASEIRYNKYITLKDSNDTITEPEKTVEDYETIVLVLHPYVDVIENKITYSMFGTGRAINDFRLVIQRLDEGDSIERCSIWGGVSYTSEVDFRYHTTNDCVAINMFISNDRFNSLCEAIRDNNTEKVTVRLSGVSGFYSEWSPSISTKNIKVLASENTFLVSEDVSEDVTEFVRRDVQIIVYPEGCNINPPRLGHVKEFDLAVIRSKKLDLKQNP